MRRVGGDLRRAAVLAIGCILALEVTAAAPPLDRDEAPADGAGTSNADDQSGEERKAAPERGQKRRIDGRKVAPPKRAATVRGRERAAREDGKAAKKPARATLPPQGVHKAVELARLAEKITGRPVRIGDTGVERREIEVVPLLAGQDVSLDELKLLLAFHGVYLFDATDPEDGEVLVATTDPRWHPQQARYSHVLEVPALDFKRVWARLQRAIDERNEANAARPRAQREADVVGLPVESVGKIFLRAPNRRTLARLIELAQEAEAEGPPVQRVKLYAYIGKYRLVRDLQADVETELSKGERERARFVVMSSGNRLLYRAPAPLGERITALLEKLDRRRKSRIP